MPVYEYYCDKCELEVMELQKMGDDAPQCLQCGGVMLRKFSPIATLVIKGQGNYPIRSKGYKEGYSKEYLKSVGVET